MTRAPDIDQALVDPRFLGAGLGDPASWSMWRMVMKAAFGIESNRDEARAFAAVAGDRAPPTKRVRELWCIIGRRAGKSRMAAAIAVYVALFEHRRLAPGEVGYVLVLSPTMLQARIVFDYCLGFIEASPVLRQEIAATTASEIRLRNGVVIGVHPNSFRSIRGRTLVACVMDESAFWRDERSALPDVEAYRAVLFALAPAGMIVGISTPYRRSGLLHQKYRDHYGVDGDDVLVVQGSSKSFNPTIADAAIAAQRSADPTGAVSELDAEFRADMSALLDDRDVDAAIDRDRPSELPPQPGIKYVCFCDPSGGRHDHMTAAIGHKAGDDGIVDAIRGFAPPFDPKFAVDQIASLCKQYGITEIVGDAFAAAWVETAFCAAGIKYRKADKTKSQIYLETLPLFARGQARLPDHPRLLRELRLLQRVTHAGGRESVDHLKSDHDDYSNSACGVLYYAAQRRRARMLFRYAAAPYGDGAGGEVFEVTKAGLVPVAGRPMPRLIRAADGSVKLRGSDNSAHAGVTA